MNKRIGFFVPEFPGQTHIFLWRERRALFELGIDARLVSTSCPPTAISSHDWAQDAKRSTRYLLPFSVIDTLLALIHIAGCGPQAVWRCMRAVIFAEASGVWGRLRLLAIVLVAAKLSRLARQDQWSHMHVHSCGEAANVAVFASLLSSLPYSLTLHGPTLEGYGANQAQKWKNAAFAIVISNRLAFDIRGKLAGSLPADIAIAPMGVDIDLMHRKSDYQPWRQGETVRIFSCGRLNPVKAHENLFATIKALRQRGVDVKLQIAGEDEKGGLGFRKVLEARIVSDQLVGCVELLGAISEERVRQALENAHVFALASLDEGISVAIMEAMAMEMPVVVTDVGGNGELADHRQDAILVPPGQPDTMADAIEEILMNPAFALSLSRASRAKVAAKFHHRASAQAIASLLPSSADAVRSPTRNEYGVSQKAKANAVQAMR